MMVMALVGAYLRQDEYDGDILQFEERDRNGAQHEGRQQHQPGGGSAQCEIELNEGQHVGKDRHHVRRPTRAAAGHDIDVLERAELEDCPQQDGHQQRRLKRRQGDMPELPPRSGPIDRGRLVGIGRDRPQPGQQQQRDIGRALSDIHHRDRDGGQITVAKPNVVGR